MWRARRWWVAVVLVPGLVLTLGGASLAAEPDELVERIATADEAAALKALEALGEAAVPALRKGLMSAHPLRRQRCAEVLGRIGRAAAEAEADLTEALLDEHENVRAAAGRALGLTVPYKHMLVMRMSGWINADPSPKVRAALVQGLALLGPKAATTLSIVIRNTDHRKLALDALRELGPEASPALEALLGDPSWHVREWVVRLHGVGPSTAMPASWLGALAKATLDPAETVRRWAGWSLVRGAKDDPRVVPHLLELLASHRWSLRMHASYGFALRKPLDPAAVKPLLALAADPAWQTRTNVAWALGHAQQARPEILGALVKRLDDENEQVRVAAARGLVVLGAPRDEALAVLADHVRRSSVEPPYRGFDRELGYFGGRVRYDMAVVSVHESAAVLIGVGARAVPHLEKALAAGEVHQQMNLVHALGRIGEPAADALVRALKHPSESVRRAAACCLSLQGERGRPAIPILLSLVPSEVLHEEVTELGFNWPDAAAAALVKLGPVAVPSIEAAKKASEPARAKYLDMILAKIRKEGQGGK